MRQALPSGTLPGKGSEINAEEIPQAANSIDDSSLDHAGVFPYFKGLAGDARMSREAGSRDLKRKELETALITMNQEPCDKTTGFLIREP